MRHAPHDERAEPVRPVRAPTLDDLESAWQTVHSVLEPTPLVASPIAPTGSLKLEPLQPTGAFKGRGGLAGGSALPQDQRAVTASAGNHGLGVAWASARLGRQATVVVPEHSSAAKLAALRTYPIELVEHGADYEAAEKYALELGAAEGVSFVSPYNDPFVIAGQATIGRELDSQAPGELTVVAPVGGGGLLAGLALWARSRPGVRLAGGESSESRGISAAVAAGHIVHVPVGDTIAGGEPRAGLGDCGPGRRSTARRRRRRRAPRRDALAVRQSRPRHRGFWRSRDRGGARWQGRHRRGARGRGHGPQHRGGPFRKDPSGRLNGPAPGAGPRFAGRTWPTDQYRYASDLYGPSTGTPMYSACSVVRVVRCTPKASRCRRATFSSRCFGST